MMHAGVLKKFGLYGLFMFQPLMEAGFLPWTNILLVLLVCNVIWVGYVTVNQKRLDLLLGNSSVMHMGYIFLAFAALIVSGSAEANPWAVERRGPADAGPRPFHRPALHALRPD